MQTPNFQTILSPVDFSDLSAHALRYAALVRCGPSKIMAVHASAFEAPVYFTENQLEALNRQFREAKGEAERSLRKFVESTLGAEAAGVAIRVVEAAPADAIRQLSAEMHAGLVVMGTHGRSGVRRWMLGSVAERVLRESAIPVLTVRGNGRLPVAVQNILCPVNDTEMARRALAVAIGLAACFDATVTAVHIQEPHADRAIGNLCAWISAEERRHCEIRELVRKGEAAEEIVALAAETSCDLLVIGAQHRRFADSSILGTTTVRTVRYAPCPVLTIIGQPAVPTQS